MNHNKRRLWRAYLFTATVASLLGTYLDLWLVGKGFYAFPRRPYPNVFTINILFPLVVLPVGTFFILFLFRRFKPFERLCLSVIISFAMAFAEHLFERFGFFRHTESWSHIYSFFGYFCFILLIWKIDHWFQKE